MNSDDAPSFSRNNSIVLECKTRPYVRESRDLDDLDAPSADQDFPEHELVAVIQLKFSECDLIDDLPRHIVRPIRKAVKNMAPELALMDAVAELFVVDAPLSDL